MPKVEDKGNETVTFKRLELFASIVSTFCYDHTKNLIHRFSSISQFVEKGPFPRLGLRTLGRSSSKITPPGLSMFVGPRRPPDGNATHLRSGTGTRQGPMYASQGPQHSRFEAFRSQLRSTKRCN